MIKGFKVKKKSAKIILRGKTFGEKLGKHLFLVVFSFIILKH